MNKRLHPRLAQLGRIRLGDRKGTRGAPRRLQHFRLTVPYAQKPLLEFCATLYGGTVVEWDNPAQGREWELLTQANSLKVLILPHECVVSYCELWGNAGLVRRCDGETVLTDTDHPEHEGHPCLCPEDVEERQALAKEGRACSDKTRISILLPDVPAIGLWRLDTGSYYGATEAIGQVALLQQMGITQPVEAVLTISEHKTKRRIPGKDKPETRRFLVPTLRILMTPKQVLLEMPQVKPAQPQLTSGPEAAALLYGGVPADYAAPRPGPLAVTHEDAPTSTDGQERDASDTEQPASTPGDAEDAPTSTDGQERDASDTEQPASTPGDSGASGEGFLEEIRDVCRAQDVNLFWLAIWCQRKWGKQPADGTLTPGEQRVLRSRLSPNAVEGLKRELKELEDADMKAVERAGRGVL